MNADRFQRLRATRTFRDDGHQRWQRARVAVVGAGNLGGRVAPEVVRSGASVWICDPDTTGAENLGTQLGRAGVPKARGIANVCEAIAAGRAASAVADVRQVGVGVLAGCRLLVDASDDAGLGGYLTEVSNGLGVPLLRVAVDGSGERELGRVLASDGGNGHACQLCTADSLDAAAPRTPCPGDGLAAPEPTRAGGALGSAVAGLAVLQAQRLVTGNDAGLVRDREVLLDLDGMQLLPLQLERCPQCPSGHRRWRLEDLGRPATEVTVGELWDRARQQLGGAVSLAPFRSRADLARAVASGFGSAPLAELGVPAAGVVLARAPGQPTVGFLMNEEVCR